MKTLTPLHQAKTAYYTKIFTFLLSHKKSKKVKVGRESYN